MKISVTDVTIKEIMIDGKVEYNNVTYFFYAFFQEMQEGRKLINWEITEARSKAITKQLHPYPDELKYRIAEFLCNEDQQNFELEFISHVMTKQPKKKG